MISQRFRAGVEWCFNNQNKILLEILNLLEDQDGG
jgi:hypothetical protein